MCRPTPKPRGKRLPDAPSLSLPGNPCPSRCLSARGVCLLGKGGGGGFCESFISNLPDGTCINKHVSSVSLTRRNFTALSCEWRRDTASAGLRVARVCAGFASLLTCGGVEEAHRRGPTVRLPRGPCPSRRGRTCPPGGTWAAGSGSRIPPLSGQLGPPGQAPQLPSNQGSGFP